jgi:hypothetical protein
MICQSFNKIPKFSQWYSGLEPAIIMEMKCLNLSGLWDWPEMKMCDCVSKVPDKATQVVRVVVI